MATSTSTPAKDDQKSEPEAQTTTATADKPEATAPAKKKTAKKPAAKKNGGKAPNAKPAPNPMDGVKSHGEILEVPIAAILRYDNPRNEPENLFNEGYLLFGDPAIEEADPENGVYISLFHMATSKDMEEVGYFVELIEEFENVDKSDPLAPQSIVELADSIAEHSQWVPVMLRREGQKGFAGLDGGRRITAILYLHARARVQRHEGEKGVKLHPATVLATESKCKQGEMKRLSLKINMDRKELTELQQGKVFHDMLQDENPETGRKWTMKDLAKELGVQYSTFRNRQALWVPSNGKEGKAARGLTEGERRRVAAGTLGVTAASRKSLGEQHYSDTGKPSENRRKAIPLAAMEALFDETGEANKARRYAIAQCMGLMESPKDEKGYAKAVKESEKRIAKQDEIDMQKQQRANASKATGRAAAK